jgi:hypothetical protein
VQVDEDGNENGLVSLLDIPKREFPIEIEIADDEYLIYNKSYGSKENDFDFELNDTNLHDRYRKRKYKNIIKFHY